MAPARKRAKRCTPKGKIPLLQEKMLSDSKVSLKSNDSNDIDDDSDDNDAREETNLRPLNAVITIPQLNFASDTDITPNFGFSPPPPVATEPIDPSLGFHRMAGCESLIEEVKTRILFPILNKSFMERHGRTSPKGIMLHGPPGTGKTLFAKCLAAELSRFTTQYTNRYSFFMRRGTDIMSMWVGESEKRLRAVFTRAVQAKPSVLFFDEIDSLAPNRNNISGNCPAFSNVVTTLLSEMDKVKHDGQVIILFATNRLDTVDPALRRPGRCDVSIQFHPPSADGRKHILELYTQNWGQSSPSSSLLNQLVLSSNGFTGADLDKLCSEAFFTCIRRTRKAQSRNQNRDQDQIQSPSSDMNSNRENNSKLLVASVKKVVGNERVTREDWTSALASMAPSPTNVFGSYIQVLQVSDFIHPLILKTTDKLCQLLKPHIPETSGLVGATSFVSEIGGPNCFLVWNTLPKSDDILDALILPTVFGFEELNNLTTFILNEETMLQEHKQFSINAIIDIVNQSKKSPKPSILYIPRIDKLAQRLSADVSILRRLLFDTASKSVLVVATASVSVNRLPGELQPAFDGYHTSWQLTPPSEDERWEFFSPIFDELAFAVASLLLGGGSATERQPSTASVSTSRSNYSHSIQHIKKKRSNSPNNSNFKTKGKNQAKSKDIKLNCRLDKILNHTIDATDHDDMWSMITLHRELTNICKRYESEGLSADYYSYNSNNHESQNQLKILGKFLDDLQTVVNAYDATRLDAGTK